MLIKGDFIAPIDIKDAHRAISIHYEDHPQKAMQWDWDDCSGPKVFLTTAYVWDYRPAPTSLIV